MTILLMLNNSCNLSCAYCFLSSSTFKVEPRKIDIEKVKKAVLEAIRLHYGEGYRGEREVVLHGGEPFLTPRKVLVEILDFLEEHNIRVGAQSNCLLFSLDPSLIDLAKRYRISVGCSIDGYPEQNILRGFYIHDKPLDEKLNLRISERIFDAVKRLKKEGVLGGIITVLHKKNAYGIENLEKLSRFITEMEVGFRLNPMYSTVEWAKKYELSNDELFEAYKYIFHRTAPLSGTISPYRDIINKLLGREDNVVCWLRGCDFYRSHVITVLWDGRLSTCDRTFGQEIYQIGFYSGRNIRFRALQNIYRDPLGHVHMYMCPAESPNGDWRYPSRFLDAFKRLINYLAMYIRTIFPEIHLIDEVEPMKYIEYVERGCRWDPWRGEFICQ